jgi:hypothetical protein
MIKSALIAATLAAGAFATTSAFAFHPVGGFKGGLGSHFNQPRPSGPLGHHFGHFGRGTVLVRGIEATVIRPCVRIDYVDADGNPAYRLDCRRLRDRY